MRRLALFDENTSAKVAETSFTKIKQKELTRVVKKTTNNNKKKTINQVGFVSFSFSWKILCV